MRIDIISIFPEYFGPLSVSLIGKASERGILGIHTHDLRDFTHDRHRTVDDTPYGGGAGMVMKPEPWGEALDAVLADDLSAERPVIVFLSPAGELFSQRMAGDFAHRERLIFCCGRYEGIDERVVEYAKTRAEVHSVSIGDYVLNGGEVAAMAIIEAVGRLVPGVIGNPESLVEESHTDGLLEYPSYTKPESWRGMDVPPILLSGNHAAIADWHREQQLERTRRVRPDLFARYSDEHR